MSNTYESSTARVVLTGTQGVTYIDDKGKRATEYGTPTVNVTRNHRGVKRTVTVVPAGTQKASLRLDLDRVALLISPSTADRALFNSHRAV